ncbi:CBS domain-containing protein [Novosphingobium piscinae]|uniref:CBS domain-containing protein n=1 Tax=Novosphingobium piscinae TaxID=1507448 RepID=A0A7X1FZV4_9SPHN|nr:CBS domain-containing protein [Novosphingobium piscinae]MBC2670043.1 CBS domain-containing protein [Novosphingobium piscinae]
MTISRILKGRDGTLISATPDMTVRAVVALLAERRIGALPIMADGTAVGIFSERDVLYCLAREGAGVLDRPVGEVMTSPPITVTPDTSILAALSLMTRRRIRHLPVVDGTRVIGFVSIGDLVKYRIDAIEAEAEALRSYIQTA